MRRGLWAGNAAWGLINKVYRLYTPVLRNVGCRMNANAVNQSRWRSARVLATYVHPICTGVRIVARK